MTKHSPTLQERIEAALQPDAAVTAADLAALIEEVEAFIVKADEDWMIDQTRSPDLGMVGEETLDATLTANGLRMELPKLQARYQEVDEQEQSAARLAKYDAAWRAEHDAWKRDRDVLAEDLREVYPDAARGIADLVVRLAANNKTRDELNRGRPAGVEEHLLSAEQHARALDGLSYNGPSLLDSVRLFDWNTGRQICPPEQPSMAAAFAATAIPAPDRRFTADWAQDNERRAAGQRAESQRIADFYARQTREREARENREAQERFAESQRRKWGGS
jgi:hypothetical protein